MGPFFSVIIPTLNEEKFLPLLLADLKKQNEKSFEVLIIDCRSTDNTFTIAQKFKEELPLSTYTVEKKNVSFQRNFGAAHAQGSFLVFLDADARINSSFLKTLKKEINKWDHLIYIPSFNSQEKFFQDDLVFRMMNFLIDFSQNTSFPYSIGGNMIFHKDCFNFVGGFDEKIYFSEDHEIIQRAKKKGVTAKHLEKVTVKTSMRRFAHEGYLNVVRKYLIILVHNFKKGKIEEKIFEYQMGGGHYKTIRHKPHTMDMLIKNYFKKIKRKVGNFTLD